MFCCMFTHHHEPEQTTSTNVETEQVPKQQVPEQQVPAAKTVEPYGIPPLRISSIP